MDTEELKKNVEELRIRYEEAKRRLNELEYEVDIKVKKSWWQKIEDVLKERKRLFYATDILLIIQRNEAEDDKENFNKDLMQKNLWAAFTNKTKSGELGRIRLGKEFMYGLKDWFNEDGTVKDEFKIY